MSRAEKYISTGRFADARDELAGLEHAQAKQLRHGGAGIDRGEPRSRTLWRMLETMNVWIATWNSPRVSTTGVMEEEFKQVRRYVRELR